MEGLPYFIVPNIIAFMDVRELCRCACVDREWASCARRRWSRIRENAVKKRSQVWECNANAFTYAFLLTAYTTALKQLIMAWKVSKKTGSINKKVLAYKLNIAIQILQIYVCLLPYLCIVWGNWTTVNIESILFCDRCQMMIGEGLMRCVSITHLKTMKSYQFLTMSARIPVTAKVFGIAPLVGYAGSSETWKSSRCGGKTVYI